VLRYLPEKQRYTLELLEPPAGGGGAGQRMDVRPANFVLKHLPAGTRCARARRLHWLPRYIPVLFAFTAAPAQPR
jgi:hypothetical protein